MCALLVFGCTSAPEQPAAPEEQEASRPDDSEPPMDSGFTWEKDGAYRHNIVRRKAINKASGEVAFDQELIVNHAKVMYDPKLIDPALFRESGFWNQKQ